MMRQTRFTNIRIILKEASSLFDEGKLTVDEYENLIDVVEMDYNAIVKDMEAQEMVFLPKLFQVKFD